MAKSCIGSEKINEYLDKQANLKKKGLSLFDAELERHLEECPQCQKELQEKQDIFDVLGGLRQLEVPPDFTAQLMARLPQPARQIFPNWSLLVSSLIFGVSAAIFYSLIYSVLKYSDKLHIIKAILNALIIKAWDMLEPILIKVYDTAGLLFRLAKALWVLVESYPVSFITLFTFAVFLFTILVTLINNFQRENYA